MFMQFLKMSTIHLFWTSAQLISRASLCECAASKAFITLSITRLSFVVRAFSRSPSIIMVVDFRATVPQLEPLVEETLFVR